MTSSHTRALIIVASALALARVAEAQAQRRASRPATAGATAGASAAKPSSAKAPATKGSAAGAPAAGASAANAPAAKAPAAAGEPADTASKLSVTTLALRRDAVKEVSDQLAGADKGASKSHGWSTAFTKTFTGDKSQIDAAKRVLGQMAQSLVASGDTTVIVVIGSTDDRDKVVESLARVQRPTRVAFVDREFADAVSDNTVLNGGMAGKFSDAATNLWVYLPRHGAAPRAKPDRVLSTKVASATLWNGIFAADGDAIDVDQVTSLAHSEHATASGDVAPATPVSPGGALAVGDVVVPKIGNVKVLAEPSATSAVLGTVATTDELVIAGAAKNGFVQVEGTSLSGWVSATLVARKAAPRARDK